MSEKNSLLSPKKPDGTTDWDVVFNDPQKGLVPLLDRVTTIDALHKCVQVMIKRLFTRKNDELDVARFNKELDDIISYASSIGDLSDVKAEVVLMLKRIKAERVEKARQFIEEKKTKGQVENRRKSGSSSADAYKFLNHPKFVPIAISSALVMVTLIVGSMFWAIHVDSNKESSAEQKRLAAEMAAVEDAAENKRNIAANKREKKKVERNIAAANKKREENRKKNRIMPPALAMESVYMKSGTKSGKPILPIFILNDRSMLSVLCKQKPKLIDKINQLIDKSEASGSKPNLVQIGSELKRFSNQIFGAKVISKVVLVASADHRDMVSGGQRCKYASKRYFDYIYSPTRK